LHPLLDVVPACCHLEGPPLHLSNQVMDCRVNITGVSSGTADPPGRVRLYGIAQAATRQGGVLGLDERAGEMNTCPEVVNQTAIKAR
jgi:hypothetical protein